MSNSRDTCLSKQQLTKQICSWYISLTQNMCRSYERAPSPSVRPVWVKCASQFCFLHPATVLTFPTSKWAFPASSLLLQHPCFHLRSPQNLSNHPAILLLIGRNTIVMVKRVTMVWYTNRFKKDWVVKVKCSLGESSQQEILTVVP